MIQSKFRILFLLLLPFTLNSCDRGSTSPPLTESQLKERAFNGDVAAMTALGDLCLDRGDISQGSKWLTAAAILGDKLALKRLQEYADKNEPMAVGGLSDYYEKKGAKKLHFEYVYRFAKLRPKDGVAFSVGILLLFGDAGLLGEAPNEFIRKRGLECMMLAADTDTHDHGTYILLAAMAKDHIIDAPTPEILDKWNKISATASDFDRQFLFRELNGFSNIKAVLDYAKHMAK